MKVIPSTRVIIRVNITCAISGLVEVNVHMKGYRSYQRYSESKDVYLERCI